MKSALFAITTATLSLGMMGIAQAGTIVAPDSVITDMGQFNATFPVGNTIDQSGLSVGYTEGDDFDAYIASSPTHSDTFSPVTSWLSASTTSGSVTFDLGAVTTVESMGFWNFFNANSTGDFNLEASLTSDFSSSVSLGSFSAAPNIGGGIGDPVPVEVFTFSPTDARFIRMNISNAQGGSIVGFGEVIFEEVQDTPTTPEPSTLLGLFLIGGVGFLAKKRQK